MPKMSGAGNLRTMRAREQSRLGSAFQMKASRVVRLESPRVRECVADAFETIPEIAGDRLELRWWVKNPLSLRERVRVRAFLQLPQER